VYVCVCVRVYLCVCLVFLLITHTCCAVAISSPFPPSQGALLLMIRYLVPPVDVPLSMNLEYTRSLPTGAFVATRGAMQWLACGGKTPYVDYAAMGRTRPHWPSMIGLSMRTALQDKTLINQLKGHLSDRLREASVQILTLQAQQFAKQPGQYANYVAQFGLSAFVSQWIQNGVITCLPYEGTVANITTILPSMLRLFDSQDDLVAYTQADDYAPYGKTPLSLGIILDAPSADQSTWSYEIRVNATRVSMLSIKENLFSQDYAVRVRVIE
jgi:hypothetical protein